MKIETLFLKNITSKSEILAALKFILNSTFFTFDDIFYKQTFGISMGSPLSPVIAPWYWRD